MRKKAAIILLQEIRISWGSKFRVQQEFRRKYPEYEYYIAAGSNIDLVADVDGDQIPSDGYNDGRAHITVVTFLHKRVFRPKALVVNWHKPPPKKALEHVAYRRVVSLDAVAHEKERISIVNMHQERARRPDLQRRANNHIIESRRKCKSQKGGRASWEGTGMQQRCVRDIPSPQSLILRK